MTYLPRAYLKLFEGLEPLKVAQESLDLVGQILAQPFYMAVVRWQDNQYLQVLAARQTWPELTIFDQFLQSQTTFLQLDYNSSNKTDLVEYLKKEQLTLIYQPFNSEFLNGGLLILTAEPIVTATLEPLFEAIGLALANATRHEQLLKEQLHLEVTRDTWQQVWASLDNQQKAIEQLLIRNQALYGIGLAINSSLHLADILSTIVSEAVQLIQASRGAIGLWDENLAKLTVMAEYQATAQLSPSEVASDNLKFPTELSPAAIASLHNFLKQDWAGTTLFSVLRHQKQILGVIILNDNKSGRIFIKDEIDTVALIGSQATVAIENARLFQAVADERNLNRAILDSIADGVFTTDLKQNITTLNPAAERLTNFKAVDVVGKNYLEALYIKDRAGQVLAREASPLFQALEDNTPRVYQLQRGGKVTDMVLIALVAAPILDDQNKISGMVGVFRDVTHEQEVARLKDELVGLVSHELRTPMASVLGFAELMLTRQVSPTKARMYIETIYKEAQRLSNLINDFLDIQRMEAGRQVYNYGEISLKPILERVAEIFAQERERLHFELPTDLPMVRADADRILQTLTNLVSNALKYSPQGGDVWVSGRLFTEAMVEIQVKDVGLGIPHEAQAQLFSKFYRVSNNDRRDIGGTGLGLAICREIVEAHGGKIWLESEPTEGSSFYFTLPVAYSRASGQGQLLEADTKLVLIVEDDESIANLISTRLEDAGYATHIAASAEQADSFLANSNFLPIAVILDISLAGVLDGWDFLLQLKANPVMADVPIIMNTALDIDLFNRALGGATFLSKPLELTTLLETINRLSVVRPQRNLLVIDDDAGLRKLLKEALSNQDFVVATVSGAEQALKYLEQNLPDVILLDLMMPKIDGFKLLGQLRANRRTLKVPVIVMSAKDLTEAEQHFLRNGVAYFLTKSEYTPQRIEELLSQLIIEQD